jgi:peptide/nickel transport system permease protein
VNATADLPGGAPSRAAESGTSAPGRTAHAAARRRRLAFAIIPVALFVAVAVGGPRAFPYDARAVSLVNRLAPPGAVLTTGERAWLGTDRLGRDVLAQVVAGARVSLLVGATTVLIAGAIGLLLGLTAGYFGGAFDNVVMRLADVQLAFPPILLAILIASVLGPSVPNVIATLAITRWVKFARVVRSATLTAKERDYVQAARGLGASHPRILWRHVFPFTLTPFLVMATVEFGLVIIAEAGLSFLGLGTPERLPSWGLTIASGRDYLGTAWWISAVPGIALVLAVVFVGTFGDQLRDYLDPRLRHQGAAVVGKARKGGRM